MEGKRYIHKAKIEIQINDKKTVDAVIRSIDTKINNRASINAREKMGKLIINIRAIDITALRAAVNSILRIVGCVEDLQKEGL